MRDVSKANHTGKAAELGLGLSGPVIGLEDQGLSVELTGRVLLVEADPELASHWSRVLSEVGLRVETAAELESLPEAFDLVVLGEVDGPSCEILERLRRTAPRVAVLWLVASGTEGMTQCLESGDRVLLKPFSAGDLVREVRLLLLDEAENRLSNGRTRAAAESGKRAFSLRQGLALAMGVIALVALGFLVGSPADDLPAPSKSGVVRGNPLEPIEPRGNVTTVGELTWAPQAGAERYAVWIRRIDGSVVWQVSSQLARVDAGAAELLPGVPYEWEIEAFDEGGRRLGISQRVGFRWVEEVSP